MPITLTVMGIFVFELSYIEVTWVYISNKSLTAIPVSYSLYNSTTTMNFA